LIDLGISLGGLTGIAEAIPFFASFALRGGSENTQRLRYPVETIACLNDGSTLASRISDWTYW
jgi:hypothetical protein